MKDKKKLTVGLIFSWAFGLFFTVGALGMLGEDIPTALLILCSGLVLLPPVRDLVYKQTNIEISGGLRFFIALALFVGAAYTLPEDVKAKSENQYSFSELKNFND